MKNCRRKYRYSADAGRWELTAAQRDSLPACHAEIWGAAIIGVAAVGGAALQADAAGDAADAQGQASGAAIGEQRRQFDTLLSLTSNQRAIGNQALNALGGIYGYTPATGFEGTGERAQEVNAFDPQAYLAANPDVAADPYFAQYPEQHWLRHGQYEGRARPIVADRLGSTGTSAASGGNQLAGADYSSFYRSPDYNFRLTEGLSAVQGSAAAAGGLYSGNALRGITDYSQGLAASEFGNYVNRQLALAGMGQTATTQAGNAAMTTGTNIGNLLVNQGNARASGIVNQSNAIAGGVNDLASLYGMYRGGYFGGGGNG